MRISNITRNAYEIRAWVSKQIKSFPRPLEASRVLQLSEHDVHGRAMILYAAFSAFSLAPVMMWDKSPTRSKQSQFNAPSCKAEQVVLTWKLEGEVEGGKHDGSEDPPTQHASNEAKGTAGDLKSP